MTTRFADHLLEGDHTSRPAFGDVPTGTLYACSDHGLIYQSDGSAWATWATLGGGDASTVAFTPAGTIAATDVQAAIEEVASEAASGGGGPTVAFSGEIANKTFTLAAETALSTTDDVVIAAVAGDVVEIHAAGEIGAGAQGLYLLAYSMVGGVKTNPVANYPTAWRALSTSSTATPFGGSSFYTVLSGDLSGGNLTVRMYGAQDTDGGADRAANGVRFAVKNWGQ